ncbi:MAG: glutamate 5-kinase [Synergistaceae bacterium]|nr:glutamate 5-kinase [Synergistaceae bacterium]
MESRKKLKTAKRIVVKIGTSSVTHSNGRVNLQRMKELALVLSDIRNRGIDVILVSSGAVGAGLSILGLKERPKEILLKLAAASVGQASLMQMYRSFFSVYNQTVAQILLTKEDVRARGDVVAGLFNQLLNLGIIPIVNNNDAVATDEIEFSDNDYLSAVVSGLISADLLVILTDTDGLCDENPKTNKDAKRIPQCDKITAKIESIAEGKGSAFAMGGMATKIIAAKKCTKNGCDTVIAKAEDPSILYSILDGADVGTLFPAKRGASN